MQTDRQHLTPKEMEFCFEYLSNGCDAKEAAKSTGHYEDRGYYLLLNPLIKKFIDKHMKKAEKELGANFYWKITKLKRYIDLTCPDDAQHFDETHPSFVSAMSELNKLEGDYPAEKRQITVTDDRDINEGNEEVQKLIKKNERDY